MALYCFQIESLKKAIPVKLSSLPSLLFELLAQLKEKMLLLSFVFRELGSLWYFQPMRVISPITYLRNNTPTPLSIDYLDAEGPLLHEPKVIVFLNQQILFLTAFSEQAQCFL